MAEIIQEDMGKITQEDMEGITQEETFLQKFDKHLDKKFSKQNSSNIKIGFLIPVIISFIGAYGILVESVGSVINTLLKDNYYCNELSKKIFVSWIGLYESVYGLKKLFSTIIDESTRETINTSFSDLYLKIDRTFNNLIKTCELNCKDIIYEKLNEMNKEN